MPSCDFYAIGEGFEPVLGFVFDRLDGRVFESLSKHNQDLQEFGSIDEIKDSYPPDTSTTNSSSAHLAIWLPNTSKDVRFKKIELKVKYKPEAKFRYQINGWGLLHLHCGAFSELGIKGSFLNHNTEKRAQKWVSIYADEMGLPDTWDWKEVHRAPSRLNRYIRKLEVSKIDARSVFPLAAEHIAQGATLL